MDFRQPLAVVTATVDGDVLSVLAAADAAFTTGELHRALGRRSVDGIRKALERLAGQGIVDVDVVGQTRHYRLNREHLAAGPIIELANLRNRLLDAVSQRISTWDEAPVYAAIFGSVARGGASPDSDVDLFLVRRDDSSDRWDEQVAELSSAITAWTGNDTRVLEYTAEEVRTLGADEQVLESVRDDGLVVAGRRSWLISALNNNGGKHEDERLHA